MTEKKMLKDEELEKVSGGYLKNNWKEELNKIAGIVRERGYSYYDFKEDTLKGHFDDCLTNARNKGISEEERDLIKRYLKQISW